MVKISKIAKFKYSHSEGTERGESNNDSVNEEMSVAFLKLTQSAVVGEK